jgi:hypothetical protein
MNLKRWISTALCALLLVPGLALVASVVAAPSASARACVLDHTYVKKTYQGSKVWIPTSLFPVGKDFQDPGTLTVSRSDGQMYAKMKGSSDTAGGGGGVNIGVAQVSAKYDHTWNRSTTTTDSWTTSYSRTLSSVEVFRLRVYRSGFKFKYVAVAVYTPGHDNCPDRVYTKTAVLPSERREKKVGVETYANRGKTQPRG